MATFIDNLKTRQAAIGVELAALSATAAGGKPNAGKSGIDHIGYKKSLYDELAQITNLINKAQVDAVWDAGGYESLSIGET